MRVYENIIWKVCPPGALGQYFEQWSVSWEVFGSNSIRCLFPLWKSSGFSWLLPRVASAMGLVEWLGPQSCSVSGREFESMFKLPDHCCRCLYLLGPIDAKVAHERFLESTNLSLSLESDCIYIVSLFSSHPHWCFCSKEKSIPQISVRPFLPWCHDDLSFDFFLTSRSPDSWRISWERCDVGYCWRVHFIWLCQNRHQCWNSSKCLSSSAGPFVTLYK